MFWSAVRAVLNMSPAMFACTVIRPSTTFWPTDSCCPAPTMPRPTALKPRGIRILVTTETLVLIAALPIAWRMVWLAARLSWVLPVKVMPVPAAPTASAAPPDSAVAPTISTPAEASRTKRAAASAFSQPVTWLSIDAAVARVARRDMSR